MPEPGGRFRSSSGRRALAFLAVVVLLVGGTVAYLLVQRSETAAATAAAAEREAGTPRLPYEDILGVPHLVVRNTEAGPSFGKVALIPLDDPDGPRAIVDISCERISATASGAVCLQQVPGMLTSYRTVFLDSRLREIGGQDLAGIPSRARLSRDGRYAASTAFVAGHAYTDAQFSTETVITDLESGTPLGELETWTTFQGGAEVTAVDRNYWGVTFLGDGPRFYATLGTGGQFLLVEGDVTARTMEVIGVSGACPSVSPDGTSVVYKRVAASGEAGFVTLDLESSRVVPLDEVRVVDDQASWADEDTVLYTVARQEAPTAGSDVWSAPVAGGPPRLLVPDAASPSVVRPER
ncbi:TolB-like translocation protein [Blastococcus deserti]|uniref:WD40 repeat protein n=1 Tax=Blastococcus deserti TaxID=2259033 RepID=A0ABW4XAJ8_9ACTN